MGIYISFVYNKYWLFSSISFLIGILYYGIRLAAYKNKTLSQNIFMFIA